MTVSRFGSSLRLAAIVSVVSGLVGGAIWTLDLMDRSDGDDLRWGFFHNPWMGFTPFNEAFLEASMSVLLACSAAIGLGGILLLARCQWGVALVSLQAPISIATNTVVVLFIALMMLGVVTGDWTGEALALRLGSIAVNAALWRFLRSSAVTESFTGASTAAPPNGPSPNATAREAGGSTVP